VKPAAYIGTSGWNYKHWREIIYPKGFGQAKWLGFTAERFDTVEVNTSFYRIPKPETLAAWQEQTPPSFRFALKLWRGITHYRKLVNSTDLLERFFQFADVLEKPRRAPLLVQLPPNQSINLEKLDRFFDDLQPFTSGDWQVCIEFRHDSWLIPETNQLLDRRGAALCLHDMIGAGAVSEPNDVPFIYVRRHGQSGRYSGNYGEDQIAADAARIRAWIQDGRNVYQYYNNDIGGHAFWNALELRKSVAQL
jgi:uncharacterized protein YecE (DUF72 family)